MSTQLIPQLPISLAQIPRILTVEVKLYNAYKFEPKFNNASMELQAEAIKALQIWTAYLGIKAEAEDFQITLNSICKHFGTLTVTDLMEAIDLFISRELNARDSDYDFAKLSPLFVGKVLSLYMDYRKKVIHSAIEKINRIPILSAEPSEKDRITTFRQLLVSAFKASMEGDTYDDPGSVIFEFIAKNNLIQFTQEIIDNASEYGVKNVKTEDAEKQTQAKKEIASQGFSMQDVFESSRKDRQKKYSRIYITNFWLKLIYQNIKISDKEISQWVYIQESQNKNFSAKDFSVEFLKEKALLKKQYDTIDNFLNTITFEMINKDYSTPAIAPKPKKVLPENCIDCANHVVEPDPDPDDTFNNDDVKVFCKLAKRNRTISCRPDHTRDESIRPDWCPLLKN